MLFCKKKDKMEHFIDKYTYRIGWSEEDQSFIAKCLELPSLAAHGDSSENALHEIKLVVTESVKWIEQEGGPVPEPFWVEKV
jgi:predicted RNase H-like HicB family nuclease